MEMQKINFFKNKKIRTVIKTQDGEIFFTDQGQYLVQSFVKAFYPLLELKKHWYREIQKILPNVITLQNIECVGDRAFLIKDYREDVKYSLEPSALFNYGQRFGVFLQRYHQKGKREKSKIWVDVYNYKINSFLHAYGLGDYRGPKDYIFLDYIKRNRYLLDDCEVTHILYLSSFDRIHITSDGRFDFSVFNQSYLADPYFEFRHINLYQNGLEAFLYGILEGYFNGRVPRHFFKVLALYTIVEGWGENFIDKQETDVTVLNSKAEDLAYIYDDFSTVLPRWYREERNDF